MPRPDLRRHAVAVACLLLAGHGALRAAPLSLAQAPANASTTEPAPNVILSIDDSGSMSEKLDPANPALGRKIDLLKSSLIATFGNGTANSGIIPDGRIRLAWHAMHNNGNAPDAKSLVPGKVNSIRPFSGTHRTKFNDFVNSIDADNGTPSLTMMQRVYDYARSPVGLHSPWADSPGTAQNVSVKPYLACRRMYHIFLTDGAWNSQNASQRVGDGDSVTQVLGDGATTYSTSSNQTLVYRDAYGDTNPNKASTLSDFAFRNWATDMQDGTDGTAAMPNEVRPLMRRTTNETFTTPTCSAAGNCIVTQPFWNPRNDPATWQHVVQFTIGFGLGSVNWTFRKAPVASSSIYYTNTTLYNASSASGRVKATATDIAERATPVDWDTNNTAGDTFGGDLPRLIQGELVWPDVYPEQTSFGDREQDTRTVELWHAALNGRGKFFPVKTASGLTAAFTEIINNVIQDTSVPLLSIATNASYLRQGMYAYIAGYNSATYSGTLTARPIDPASGAIQATEAWSASTLLDARSTAEIGNRVVWSHSGTAGIAFKTLGSQSATTQQSLNTNASGVTDNKGQDRLNYLRGDNSKTESAGGPYRDRESRLGDIVNSNVLYVGAPTGGHGAQGYGTFAAGLTGRTPMVYVGSNDGMLHGFTAAGGVEKLAYVPLGLAQTTLRQLTDPGYTHRYFVDGSPFAGDAYLGSTTGWRTVLIGTLGAGGKGWFALDVTNPANFTDALAGSGVLLDATASTDADIGHIVSPPSLSDGAAQQSRQIVKLNNGRWAAVMGNGVNSANEAPVLIVQYLDGDRSIRKLSPCTQPIATTACSFKGSNGLSTPMLVDLNGDGTADVAYAGDLQGQLWKFDLTASDPASWKVAFSGAPLFVARRSGAPQPITSAPYATAHPAGGLMVAVGTGQNLTVADRTSTTLQSLYAVWDRSTYGQGSSGLTLTDATPVNSVSSPSLSSLVQQTYNATPLMEGSTPYYSSSNQTVDYSGSTPNLGWYLDWPVSGQRVVTNIQPFAGQKILVESMVPATSNTTSGETCTPTAQGGRRFLSILNMFTGGVPATQPFTLTSTAANAAYVTMVESSAGQSALVRTGTRIKQLASNCPSGQTCQPQTWNPGQTMGARANWRQLLQ